MALAWRRAGAQRLARKLVARPNLRLKRRVPSRSVRYQQSVKPAENAELRYRLAMKRVVAKWWARIGPQALRIAKKIAPPITSDAGDDGDDLDTELGDFSEEASATWFVKSIDNVANDVLTHSERELKRIGIKLKKADPGVAKMVPQWRRENVDLVQTMFKREKTALEKLLEDGAGRRWESLSRDIEARFDITTRHAELIARDQTSKLNSNISHQRMRNAGITRAVWTAVADERTRPSHMALDGVAFDLDDPPTPDDEDEPMLPGEPICCRCTSFPLLDELQTSADDDSEEDSSDA